VVVSTQHTRDVKHSELRSFVIEEVIKKVLPKEMLSEKTHFLVNPTGNFVIGGPQGDAGLTGARSLSIPMAEWAGTAEARSQEKTRAKSIAALLTWDGGLRKM